MVWPILTQMLTNRLLRIPSKQDHTTNPYNKPLPNRIRDELERSIPDFTVKFREDRNGFYINDRKFAPDDEPMTRVKVGTYTHWRVYECNKRDSSVSHPSGSFSCVRTGGNALRRPEWMDTVNLAPKESLDLIMDFTDSVIRGVSVFHCTY